MSIGKMMAQEIGMEAATTRRILERVPDGKNDWKPHDKSMPLGRLATHLAEIPGWTESTVNQDELDMSGYEPVTLETSAERLKFFDGNIATAQEALNAVSDKALMKSWALTMDGKALFSAPKVGVMRQFVLNHIVHHRAQLGVYLRLLDIPVPQTLGPTADEPDM